MNVPALITYPARPIQGGRLELAPPKSGLWYAEPKLNGWRALIHTLTIADALAFYQRLRAANRPRDMTSSPKPFLARYYSSF